MPKYLKISFEEKSYIDDMDNADSLETIAQSAEVGDVYSFEIVEMPQDERDALPEFGGF